MRVHHLNCGTIRPPFERLATGTGSLLRRGTAVCHCLLVETDDGLALVDTGFGRAELRDPSLLGHAAAFLRPVPDVGSAAAEQLSALGYRNSDVRHIFLTHLDVDHRGGIADFPDAEVHLSTTELGSARRPGTRRERMRYGGFDHHSVRWVTHTEASDDWHGFPVLHESRGAGGRVLMVALPGHTLGHCGVAVETGTRWLLHAGDAFQFHGEIEDPPHAPVGIRVFNTAMEAERTARLRTVARLRELPKHDDIDIICAHDRTMFDSRERGAVG